MRSPMQAKLVTKNLVCMFECDENVRAIHAMRILFVLRSRGLLNTFSVDVSNRGVAGIALAWSACETTAEVPVIPHDTGVRA